MHAHEEDDVVLDVDGNTLHDDDAQPVALVAKLKALRAQLAKAEEEKRDNLAGWQRAKADLVNSHRQADEETARAHTRGAAALAREVLPALDALETAMRSPEWQETSEAWRTGVERVARSLAAGLERAHVTSFGAANEAFDPARHECMSVAPADNPEADHTLKEVLQKGYELRGELVRPAKVIVYQYPQAPPSGE